MWKTIKRKPKEKNRLASLFLRGNKKLLCLAGSCISASRSSKRALALSPDAFGEIVPPSLVVDLLFLIFFPSKFRGQFFEPVFFFFFFFSLTRKEQIKATNFCKTNRAVLRTL